MFTFFRKYQRFIYFVVTTVIIISFSFFGTYSAFTSGKGDDPVVFTTISGKKITRSECNDYVHFLSMDSLLSETGSSNPLNDGVIEKDILSTPIGEIIAAKFEKTFTNEWVLKFKREKNFQPYKHPQAPFISTQQIWSYFSPDIKSRFEDFQQSSPDSANLDFYHKKVALFLAEKQFPATYLRQILQYQQKQFDWVEPDIALDGKPLSLFGYQQLTDWFGQTFVEKSCEFIIQTAAKARSMGMTVSSDEVIASLYANVKKAVESNQMGQKMSVDELVKKTLLSLGMDESRAAHVWSDVLLFRRALIELPQNVLIDPKSFIPMLQEGAESVDIEGYQLQPSLRITSMRELMKVETWMNAVMKKQDSLLPSLEYRSLDDVEISFPEFVERRFVLSVSEVDSSKLMNQIRLKDVWAWQNDHWDALVQEIPSLKSNEVTDRESRFRAIEGLSAQLRAKADEIAKKAIITAHPEWLSQAFASTQAETKSIGIRLQGGSFPFEGIQSRKDFMQALLQVPIGDQNACLTQYTQDGKHFYTICVLDRGKTKELVSLPELISDGSLDSVLDKLLESSYERLRGERPSDFKKENGTWKPFQEVKDKLSELYFASFIKKLDQAVREWKQKLPDFCSWDDQKTARVAVRFLPLLENRIEKVKKEGDALHIVTAVYGAAEESPATASEIRPKEDLWTLVRFSEKIRKSDISEKPCFAEGFSVENGTWLSAKYSREYGSFVAKVGKRDIGDYQESLREMTYALQKHVGEEVVKEKAEKFAVEFFGKE